MVGRTTWALALALLLVSCIDVSTGADDAADSTTVETGPGRLVILDGSGDVVVIDPDGANRASVTDDASSRFVYTQPVWSPDGSRIAWGQIGDGGFAVGIQYPGSEEPTLVETTNLPFYTFWSPDGASLGVLHNGDAGVDFRIVDVERGTSITADSDTPYYFSWSPDGERVVAHAGENRFETITTGGDHDALEPTSPSYLAPQWTPDGIFHVVDDQLVMDDGQGSRVPMAQVSGLTTFVANPQGTRVAIQTTADGSGIAVALGAIPTVAPGNVMILDVETGTIERASQGLSAGFFWSRDGESLLILQPGSTGIVPRVWDVSGTSVDYVEYRPPSTIVRDTLPFFPQYAQSVEFWAPDSSAFAFAGEIDGEQGIWVQELSADRPTLVSDGIWVDWSSG